MILDPAIGRGGSHGSQHPFPVTTRAPMHPIMAGLPDKWLHAKDELYDRLRDPAENLSVLATACSDPEKKGTGHHEPMLRRFSSVRVASSTRHRATLGPAKRGTLCVGFIVTYQRGAGWAVTGKVTQKVPADFPTAGTVSLRKE